MELGVTVCPAKLYLFHSALLCFCHRLKDLVVHSAHHRM
jgi:hypothetical protein